MSKRKWIVLSVAVVGLLGLGGWFIRGAGADEAPPYRTGVLTMGNVESTVTSTGKLNALQSVAIGTQVSGQVTELYADYNDRVRRGDLLARIDPTLQQQAVRNAEANLERVRAALLQAERDYQRNRTLYEQQVITEAEFTQVEYSLTVARSNLTSSEVSLEQARRNLSYTEIYSPIDGIVVERNVEPGQTVASSLSAPQLYLLAADLAQMEILAGVDESDIGLIGNGMPVRFTVQAYPDDTFEGIVRQVRLSSSTQENVVNYTAVITVENPDGRLLPGMTASVDFIVERAENVFLVPNAALRFRATEEMIAQLTDSASIALARGTGGGGGGMRAALAQMAANGELPPGVQLPTNVGQTAGQAGQTPGAETATSAGSTQNTPTPNAAPQGGGTQAGGTIPAGAGAGRQRPAGGAAGGGAAVVGGGQGGRFAGARQPGANVQAGGAGGANAASPPAAPAARSSSGVGPSGEVFVPGGGAARNVQRVSFANLWYIKDGELGITRVRTGISDGTNTEISGEGLEDGMEIIIGLTQPQTETNGGGTTNPFQQQRGLGGGQQVIIQGGPGGGFGGGPGGGGRGGF